MVANSNVAIRGSSHNLVCLLILGDGFHTIFKHLSNMYSCSPKKHKAFFHFIILHFNLFMLVHVLVKVG